ncbi:hypothetical protein AK812_SmicGene27647 [Symbiodinium microadriaticum]|uniref:Uncharacterized protein n=1 Tax=Symbiodinium microadriaticum TaxID=2951 RepID=A0A1Q9D691_SYMMI|nr:hypothetical protein AK812_SmicGene27647 [Symbiodinium microadriaticum]CAE7297322.1 unnamed protein product [Symbiodinium sp. KB8]
MLDRVPGSKGRVSGSCWDQSEPTQQSSDGGASLLNLAHTELLPEARCKGSMRSRWSDCVMLQAAPHFYLHGRRKTHLPSELEMKSATVGCAGITSLGKWPLVSLLPA